MPLKLSEFLKKEKSITVEHEGETVMVSFRVNAFNTDFVDAYYRGDWNKEHPDENRLDAQLEELILGWNIVDDDEQPVPPSMELIRMLPLGLKKKLGAEMMNEMQGPGPEEKTLRRHLFDADMPPPESWMIEEWNYFQVARWLGVAPWDLAEKDSFWLERAKFYMDAEAGVRKIKKEKMKG